MVRRGHRERPKAEYLLTEASVTGQGNAGSPQRGCAKTQQARWHRRSLDLIQDFVLSLHNTRPGLCRGSFFVPAPRPCWTRKEHTHETKQKSPRPAMADGS